MSGNMNIAITKTSFQPGEIIEGTITLTLNKPIKSRGVFVSLISFEGHGGGSRGPGGKGGGSSTSKHVWESQTLDPAKEYPPYQELTYPFQLTAPSINDPFYSLGALWRYVTRDKSPRAPGMKDYWVEAKLDISMAFDVNSQKEIKIFYTSPD